MNSKLSNQCSYYQKQVCQSCDLIDHSAEEYVQLKQLHYSSTLERDENFFHGRNKAKLVVSGTVESPILGLQNKELLDCPLHISAINQLGHALLPLITEFKLVPYNLETRKGELKYLIIFASPTTHEMMLRFVMRSKEALERVQKLIPQLKQKFPQLKLISINLQPEHTAIIEGKVEIFLTENKTLVDRIGTYQFVIGPKTFYQVNSNVAFKLFSKAQEHVKKMKVKQAMDLFCGIGTFATFCAPYVEKMVGVELSQESIEYAKASAKLNKLSNTEFYAEDVDQFLKNHQEFNPELIIVNPPRRGLGKSITQKLLNLNPEHIIYSSCNPETLKEDLEDLKQKYEVVEQTPFDMFSLTHHLEVLCILKLKCEV